MRRNNYRRSGWDRDDYYGTGSRAGSQRYGTYNEGYGSYGGGGRFGAEDYDDYSRGYGGRQSDDYGSRSSQRDDYHSPRNWGRNSNYNNDHRSQRHWGRNSGYNTGYRGSRDWNRRGDDRNFFERAGDRIRETWNRWTDDDSHDRRSGYPRRNDNRDEYDDNFFQRAGRRVRDTWNDWTHRDDNRRYASRYDEDRDYDYRRNYGNTNEWMDNRAYGRENPDYGQRRRDTTANWSGQNYGRTNNMPGYYDRNYSGSRRREREYAEY